MKDQITNREPLSRRFSFISRLKATIAILMLCIGLTASAQNITVNGTVQDSTGEPLPGATVLVSGTAMGVTTDLNGNFTLTNVNANGTLNVSYVGFNPQSVSINGQTNITITLTEDSETLDEVVVVGYGTMKKSDLTGSVSTVGTEKLNAKGAPSVLENLQGTTPGVNITKSTGRANGGIDVQIRGKASINNDTKPIYVVDGVISSDIDFLNPQDIERIDVLKDASSTAIYGSRATGGVIIVTTKGGLSVAREQAPSISYDGYYGIAKAAHLPNLMNGEEFYHYRLFKSLQSINELSGNTPLVTPQTIYGYNRGGIGGVDWALLKKDENNPFSESVLQQMLANGQTYDWPNLILRDAHQQNHYLAVNGSSEHTSYHFGVGINDETGLYDGDGSSTYSFKGSVDTRVNKVISAGFNINMAYQEKKYANDNAISHAWYMNPFMIPYNEEGEINHFPGNSATLGSSSSFQFSDAVSPLDLMRNASHERKIYRLIGNAYLQLDLLKGLYVKTTFSPSYNSYRDGQFTGYANPNRPGLTYGDAELDTSTAQVTNYSSMGWIWDNMINYQVTLAKDHSINAMGLFSMEKGTSENYTWVANNVLQNSDWYNMGSGTTDNDASKSSYSKGTMVSYAFRVNYSYLGKYMLTGTVRWDGSSKLAEGNKWASFPSLAVAWRLSEESFLKKLDWLSNAKLRFSYGVTGNNSGIGNYGSIVGIGGPIYYPWGNSYDQGYYANGIVDSSLTWEKSREYNVGLDFGFLNSRITGSVDWYNKKSHGLLYKVQLPLESGGVKMNTNIGKVQNTGIEVALTTVNVESKTWNWTTSFTFSHNKNKVLQINGVSDQVIDGATNSLFVGYPVNNVYNYEWEGIVTNLPITVPDNQAARDHGFTPGEQVLSCDYYNAVYGLSEGRAIMRDVNGDGVIDAEDRTILSADPDWTGSFTSNLSYRLPKNGGEIDFGFSIYTRQGGHVYSPFMAGDLFKTSDRGWEKVMVDYYIPQGTLVNCDGMNDDGTYINPVYQTVTHYGTWPFPNATLENGAGSINSPVANWDEAKKTVDPSFVKVKNITLGYTFSKNVLKHIGCKQARVYFTVTNPFVFTKYLGFDPEWADAAVKNDGPSTVTYQVGASIKF